MLAGRFPEEIKKRPVSIAKYGLLSRCSRWVPPQSLVLYLDPPYHLHSLYLKKSQGLKKTQS